MTHMKLVNSRLLKTGVLLLGMFALTTTLRATIHPPNWSVTPSQYQYNMTVTAVLNVDCSDLSSDSNMVGAFVNGVCRGVAKTNVHAGGKNLAYLQIWSNSGSGETVVLKYYSVFADSVGTSKKTIVFSDGTALGTNASPYSIRNNDAPTSISLSTLSFPESDSIHQVVSMISCVDPDAADTHTYSLVNGTGSADNGKFLINGNSLLLNAAVNYYTQDSLYIRLRTTDNRGCFYDQTFMLTLIHVNHAPTGIHISDSTIFDHKPVHTFIGKLTSIDPDKNEMYGYALTAGIGDTNNISFSISHDSLYSAASFDWLVKKKYTIRVRTIDSLLHFDRQMTILVKNSPDPAINLALSSNRIYELQPVGTFIAKMISTDDAGPSFTYTFSNTGTNDNSNFSIVNDTLKSNAVFDFETKNLYNIILTTTDSFGLSLTKQFQIIIRDTLDTPTDMMINNASILENFPAHSLVGILSTADDNGPTANHTYSLVSGPGSIDNASFVISGDSLLSNNRFDFETKIAYSVRVQTTLVNGLFLDKSFMVNIFEGADTIQNILISNNKVYQNSAPGTIIGQLKTISQDTSDKYTYVFDNTVANDNSSFFLTPAGLLSATQTFDFDVKSSYLVSVKSSNIGGTSFIKQLTIIVKDTLEVPTNILFSDSLVADNKPAHTFVGMLATIDENGPATHVYTLVSGTGSTDNSSFTISNDSVYTKAVADYEVQRLYTIRIRTGLINGMNYEKPFQVYVTNKGERPYAHPDSIAVKEDAKPQYLLTVTASDSDATVTLHYQLLTTSVPFTMDAAGNLNLTGTLSYQTKSRYELMYRVTDDASPSMHDSAKVVVNILAVPEMVLPINNYVSPNNDGKNDYLVIQNPEVYKDYELTIYNSNGMVVLKTKAYDNSWNGPGLEAGVYYYTLINESVAYRYKGNITLVK
jgi:gliding motility-associated-like protein